jgi:hypothetical protein
MFSFSGVNIMHYTAARRPQRYTHGEAKASPVSKGVGNVDIGARFKGNALFAEYTGIDHVTLKLSQEDIPQNAYYNLHPTSIEVSGESYAKHNLAGKGVNSRPYAKDLADLGRWLDAIKRQEANGARRKG